MARGMKASGGDPVRTALTRVALLAQQSVLPERMRREVGAIVTGWAGEGTDRIILRERVEGMRDLLADGVQDAEVQASDVDRSDLAAIRQADRSVAALRATRDALVAELHGLAQAGVSEMP